MQVHFSMLTQVHPAVFWSTIAFALLALLSWYNSASPDNTMANKAAFVVPALKKHTATVIMAHGLGDR